MVSRLLPTAFYLLWLAVFSAAPGLYGQSAAIPVTVANHRCLVADPPGLPPEAPVVFILHGLGANADDLAGLCDGLNLPPCRYVLPDAPLHLPGYSPDALAWYDLQTHLRSDFVNSRDYLFKVIDRFTRDAAKPRPFVIMGFSQGGVMSLEAGLNDMGKVLAIVSMSGYIWDPSKTLAHPLIPNGTPILLTHGTMDPIVTEEITQKTLKALRDAGFHPLFKEYSMGHQISEKTLEDISLFLNSVIKKSK